MSKISLDALNGKLFPRADQRWARATREVTEVDVATLRRQRTQADTLRTQLATFLQAADARLALPDGQEAHLETPHNADWAWRPDLWRGPIDVQGLAAVKTKSMFGKDVTMFHDCALSELTLRQLRNLSNVADAPYGLQMDVFNFDGSFLSLVLDVPEAGALNLSRAHIIRLDTVIETERPIEIFARLNVKHGPNTEQIVRELPMDAGAHQVEFDLGYSRLNEKRVERAWVDLIFDTPQMNQVILRDLTFSRRPRAQL